MPVLLVLPAAICLALLWAGTVRVPAIHATRLAAAHRWLLGALALWSAALGASALPAVAAGWQDQLWYAAAVAMLCPPVAVLGARQPGASAWNAFVLVPLAIVMEWPALAQWRTSGPPDRLTLELPTVLGFGLVVTMGCGNYFGTRFTMAAGLYAASLLGVVVPAFFRGASAPEAAGPMHPEGLLASLGLLAALASARRAERLHRAFAAGLSGWDRVWLDFRDGFGIVWAKRVMDRINEAAADERWPMRLTLAGFELLPGGPDTIDAARAAERRAHWMRFLLKRFVDAEWIETRVKGGEAGKAF